MQVVVAVPMSSEEYTQRYGEVEWPVFEACPICGAHTRLQGHGSYSTRFHWGGFTIGPSDLFNKHVRVFIEQMLIAYYSKAGFALMNA